MGAFNPGAVNWGALANYGRPVTRQAGNLSPTGQPDPAAIQAAVRNAMGGIYPGAAGAVGAAAAPATPNYAALQAMVHNALGGASPAGGGIAGATPQQVAGAIGPAGGVPGTAMQAAAANQAAMSPAVQGAMGGASGMAPLGGAPAVNPAIQSLLANRPYTLPAQQTAPWGQGLYQMPQRQPGSMVPQRRFGMY